MDNRILDAFRKRRPGELPPIAAIPVLHVWNVTSRVEAPREMIFDLDDRIKVEVPGAAYARGARPGWDGFWHPVNRLSGHFPTGLLDRVKGLLPGCKVVDYRVRPAVREIDPYILRADPDKPNEPFIMTGGEKRLVPREIQIAGLIAAMEHPRSTLGMAVASGKSEVAILLACHVPGKCVIMVHRKDLLHQTAERIRIRTGEDAALIGDGIWGDRAGSPEIKFVVAMPQTAGRDLQRFSWDTREANLLVLDEVHVMSAQEWYKVAQFVKNAYFRIGLSGTPETGDAVKDLRREAATGPVRYEIKAKELADQGILVPPKVIFHQGPVPPGPLPQWDYRDARRALIEENGPRNALIVDLAVQEAQAGRRCIVFCDTLRHLRNIAGILRGTGVRTAILTGHHPSRVRGAAKKDLAAGVLEVALCTVWNEGVDLPQLESVILAAGGRSAVRMLQRVGRALRKAPGKTEAIIHDFWDSSQKHLLAHSKARLRLCRKEGFQVILPTS